jgi:hypothetical protein
MDHHRRNPDFKGRAANFCAVKFGRHDADDGETAAVDEECLADDAGIATVNSLPESVAEHGNSVTVRQGFFPVREEAAETRLQAK